MKRYEWSDALVTARANGRISEAAFSTSQKLAKEMSWSKHDGELRLSNLRVAEKINISEATFHRNVKELVSAGFMTKRGRNYFPTLSDLRVNTLNIDSPTLNIESPHSQNRESLSVNNRVLEEVSVNKSYAELRSAPRERGKEQETFSAIDTPIVAGGTPAVKEIKETNMDSLRSSNDSQVASLPSNHTNQEYSINEGDISFDPWEKDWVSASREGEALNKEELFKTLSGYDIRQFEKLPGVTDWFNPNFHASRRKHFTNYQAWSADRGIVIGEELMRPFASAWSFMDEFMITNKETETNTDEPIANLPPVADSPDFLLTNNSFDLDEYLAGPVPTSSNHDW